MAKRRTKSKGEIESEVLRGRWADLRHNESLHSAADNDAARRRCRELLEVGWGVPLSGDVQLSLIGTQENSASGPP